MSDRLSRKEIKRDKFIEDVGTAYTFAGRNARAILIAVGVLVLLVALAIAAGVYRNRQSQQAQAILGEGIAVMDAPLANDPSAAGAGGIRVKDEQERLARAEPLFQRVVRDYESTDAADVAGLYLARIEAARGNTASARERLGRFIRSHPEHVLAGAAQLSLYELQIADGRTKELVTELERQVSSNERTLPNDALLALLARAYEISGEEAKATQTYQRIVNEFPDSPYGIDAQRKLAQG